MPDDIATALITRRCGHSEEFVIDRDDPFLDAKRAKFAEGWCQSCRPNPQYAPVGLHDKRDELAGQLAEVEAELTAIGVRVKGSWLATKDFQELNVRRARLVAQKGYLVGQLRGIRAALRKACMPIERPKPKAATRLAVDGLTVFDLENALAEPQELLKQCYMRIAKLTRRHARTDEDRAILDSVHDYLRRQGSVLDRSGG